LSNNNNNNNKNNDNNNDNDDDNNNNDNSNNSNNNIIIIIIIIIIIMIAHLIGIRSPDLFDLFKDVGCSGSCFDFGRSSISALLPPLIQNATLTIANNNNDNDDKNNNDNYDNDDTFTKFKIVHFPESSQFIKYILTLNL